MTILRTSVISALCGALATVSCSGGAPAAEPSQPPTVPVSTTTASATVPPVPPEPSAQSACPERSDPYGAARSFEAAQALLATARDGEHHRAEPYAKAMALLEQAAAQGHLDAQFRYGSLQFSTLFMGQAPRAEQQGEYVAALTYLRLAALRGHDEARRYIPGLDALTLDASGQLTPPTEMPLSTIPEPWLRQAVVRSDELAACARATPPPDPA